ELPVDADLAKLIDDDGRPPGSRICQNAVEQRRLAGAEKAGQHCRSDRLHSDPNPEEMTARRLAIRSRCCGASSGIKTRSLCSFRPKTTTVSDNVAENMGLHNN